MPTPYTVTRIEIWPLDVPLIDPFVVATGARTVAENAVVRVTLAGGAHGYGEMAPFPEVGGESRTAALAAAVPLARLLLGEPATEYRPLARRLMDRAPEHPAARCALETALLDALCRALGVPVWAFLGGMDVRARETDITIPIADADKTVDLAKHWYAKGFRLLKMKVGKVGGDVDDDIGRLEAVRQALPDVRFIVDGNQGMTRESCGRLVRELTTRGAQIVLLEQPVPRADLDGLAGLRRDTGIRVAADESVRTLADAREVFRRQAADVLNIKIMKSGLVEALDIAAYAGGAGLGLMIGGMVETRLAMGCSFGLVLGMGGYDVLDLDTPLLLANDPVVGGYWYDGPMLHPCNGAGLDMEVPPPPGRTVIE
jgi:L-alanine-DL-glutamate epimerase-like enolase superfamily enzyme